MILTYKIKHGKDFSKELIKAKKVANFGIKHRTQSSKDVKHIGLKSTISNQILRKYSRNKKAKRANKVNLTVPNQSIKFDKDNRSITMACLKTSLHYHFSNNYSKINQIELDNEYAYVSITLPKKEPIDFDGYVGVDLNTTGHVVVMSNPKTGKVWKLGKKVEHIHKKYKNIRKTLQKKGKYSKVKNIKNRESRIIKDLNHKFSKKIIDIALENKMGIKLEELKGIRKNNKHSKSFRYSLNSWSFYQLQTFIEYKAKLQGVTVSYIEPAYTSKTCSRCGRIGNRNGKSFKCSCGHVENSDVNASFNIATCHKRMSRSNADRDVLEGCTDKPKIAIPRKMETIEPHML